MSKKYYIGQIIHWQGGDVYTLSSKLAIVMNDRNELNEGMLAKLGRNGGVKVIIIRHLSKFNEDKWKGNKNWGSPWKNGMRQRDKLIKKKLNKQFKGKLRDEWLFE